MSDWNVPASAMVPLLGIGGPQADPALRECATFSRLGACRQIVQSIESHFAHALLSELREPPQAEASRTNVDVPVLAVALVVFLVAGLPILGWVTGAGAWAVQRAVSELAIRKANAATDPRTKVGLLAGSMIGRGWLVAAWQLALGFTLGLQLVIAPASCPSWKSLAPGAGSFFSANNKPRSVRFTCPKLRTRATVS